ncbi:MAG TPA: chemotaxis protein CheW [Candidatus Elarobacter sp.]|nr:chemotaxis protein CheW [Candidatus Elarobacter sp.]
MSVGVASGVARRDVEVVSFRLGRQWFGVPVLDVQEVLVAQRVARVPLAPRDVRGFLNLRGQIVTAVDLHERLAVEPLDADTPMNVVVRDGDELFALIVDEVGDVVAVPADVVEPAPATLDDVWARACTGVVRWEQGLLAIVDASRLLDDLFSANLPGSVA